MLVLYPSYSPLQWARLQVSSFSYETAPSSYQFPMYVPTVVILPAHILILTIDDVDFDSLNSEVRIFTSANQSSQLCIDVVTIEDTTVEDMEVLTVLLDSGDPAVNITATTATVIILDDDSK